LIISCQNSSVSDIAEINPAADGFKLEQSDPSAIAVADEVMEAMGSRAAYDQTRYLVWNFFGSRKHWWDKHTGNIRIESEKDQYTIIMNLHEMTGEMVKDSTVISHPDSLAKYLQRGKEMWINDSYWLVMPYKLKDSGVTLKYVAEEKTDSMHYDVLSLSFDDVGVTPENKYHVYVDKYTRLIAKWSFYNNAKDTVPQFSTPWSDYNKYGNILLSSNRGNYNLTEIDAPTSLPQSVFTAL